MVKLKGDKEIGEKIDKIIGKLAEANDLKGVIDVAEFNDEDKLGKGKEMVDRLSKLVGIFEALDFRANRAEGDDLLGDAYEYLMRHFATESGKSKGQFYTPAEVSRIMAKVVGIGPKTRQARPSMTRLAVGLAAPEGRRRGAATASRIYGQEKDLATWALARMNMILHGHATAESWKGNTLADPHSQEATASSRHSISRWPIRRSPPRRGPAVSNRPRPVSRFTSAFRRPRTATTPSCCTSIKSLKSTARARSFCRTACSSGATRKPTSASNLVQHGLHQGHHRSAAEPLLRHRHPGLHRRH